jgi:hypothetical protein
MNKPLVLFICEYGIGYRDDDNGDNNRDKVPRKGMAPSTRDRNSKVDIQAFARESTEWR